MQSLGVPQGRSDHFFHAVDWLPTLSDAGIVSSRGKPLDGVSQFNALCENKEARNETFVEYSGWKQKENVADLFAVIHYDKWILVREPYGKKFLMFDLKIWMSQKTRNSLHAFQALSQTSKRKWKTTRMNSTFLLHQKALMSIVLHAPLHPQVGSRKLGIRGVENEQPSHFFASDSHERSPFTIHHGRDFYFISRGDIKFLDLLLPPVKKAQVRSHLSWSSSTFGMRCIGSGLYDKQTMNQLNIKNYVVFTDLIINV